MATRSLPRWVLVLFAAFVLAVAWIVVSRRAAVPTVVEVPVSPVTGPAPVSAWNAPASPVVSSTPAVPQVAAPVPRKPTDPGVPPESRKKVLTQEEIASGKW